MMEVLKSLMKEEKDYLCSQVNRYMFHTGSNVLKTIKHIHNYSCFKQLRIQEYET